MTSAIVYNSIDDAFPVAGVDNDSQGFRDNFNVIKNGLATASSEITDLQNNAARKDQNNNFGGRLISNAVLDRVYGSAYQTTATGNTNVSLNNGEYQVVTVNGNYILTFTDWPEVDQYGKIRLELKSDGTQRTVTFATESPNVIKKEIGIDLTVATGVYLLGQGSPTTSTFLSFPTANITSGAFQAGNKLYGTGITGDVAISSVTALSGIVATAATPPLTIGYSDITVGGDTILVMSSSVSSITNGDPVTISDVTGVPELSTSVTYYAFVDSGNIKLSSLPLVYTAIPSTGTYTGGAQTATFPKSGSSSNRLTLGSTTGMFEGMPIRFTGTGFGNVSQNTDYYIQKIIDGTGIRITNTQGGEPLTLAAATGTLTIVPRTVLSVNFTSQTFSGAEGITITVNSQGLSDPFTVSADTSRVKIVEAWKQPYSDVVYLKYIGEFA